MSLYVNFKTLLILAPPYLKTQLAYSPVQFDIIVTDQNLQDTFSLALEKAYKEQQTLIASYLKELYSNPNKELIISELINNKVLNISTNPLSEARVLSKIQQSISSRTLNVNIGDTIYTPKQNNGLYQNTVVSLDEEQKKLDVLNMIRNARGNRDV